MTHPHHTATPPVRPWPRARITPLALLRARAHRNTSQPPLRRRPEHEEAQ
ncbi:hypothetical protein V2S66_18920 [Streptomyces sp. V4-01]|uniref:Uncharacterized protein n=1 Tax=Actinacidiphila polyblastidii TaxID=3110430 RepID=A0ABU7PE14_9ACTN|nr:hypothetical protein [Streptomyces sp. V4-01]